MKQKQKRVLILTQYYYPESFRINDLGPRLIEKGYKVDALVGIPNYPEGRYFKGYGLFRKRHEVVEGVNVYRVFQTPRGRKASGVGLALNYLSFAFNATLWVLFYFAFKKKYDAIITYEPSPITQIVPAIILGKIRRTKVLSWIQDIFPDSITDNENGSANKYAIKFFDIVTDWVYEHSDKLLVSSKGMSELICRKKDFSDKIEYMPNWCSDFLHTEKIEKDLPELPKGKIIMMAGNLGAGIGPEEICKCVNNLSDLKDLYFVFVGNGSKKDYMEQWFVDNGVENAVCVGRYPVEMMPAFFSKADAMLVSLLKTSYKHLDVTVPARVQSYLSAGKPIYAMIGSGASEIINTGECGYAVAPGDYEALSKVIRETYSNEELLDKLGKNSRKKYEEEFTLEVGVDHFIKLIES